MKRLSSVVVLVACSVAMSFSQRPNFNGLIFCIDPGHGGHGSNDRHVIPDPGTHFWESESNFQKALLIRTLFQERGATVILTRTSNDTTGYPNPDDPEEPSLTARWQLANANHSAINMPGFKSLAEGDRVSFEVERATTGLRPRT